MGTVPTQVFKYAKQEQNDGGLDPLVSVSLIIMGVAHRQTPALKVLNELRFLLMHLAQVPQV